MLPITWLNRILTLIISDVSFSVCGLQCGDRRLWRSETWERSCISPYPLSIPTKNTPSLDVPTNRPSRYTWFFLKSSLLFNETIVPSSGERRKKRLPKIVKIILKIQSGKTWTAFHLLKGLQSHIYLNDWVNRTIITGDLRRVFKRKGSENNVFIYFMELTHKWAEIQLT